MASSESPYLYRILTFDRIVDLFETCSLHFSSPTTWLDPFEKTFQHRRSHAIFAQCWSKTAVSDAMWRIYSPQATSVRIRTTRTKLASALRTASFSGQVRWFLDDVEYLSTSKLTSRLLRLRQLIQPSFDLQAAMRGLFLKREAFDYESEVRALIHCEDDDLVPNRRHVRVAVDPHVLIESIMFDPRADDALVKVCKFYLTNSIHFKGDIGKSALYRVRRVIVAE